jgi:hypothetical protein
MMTGRLTVVQRMGVVVGAHLGAGGLLAAPPRVAKAAPDNGAKDVELGLKEFRVTFDQPMSTGGNPLCPKLERPPSGWLVLGRRGFRP